MWTGIGGIKARVNFDGTSCTGGWCTIRSSYNISGVYRNSTGVYTVYFQNAAPSGTYSIASLGGRGTSNMEVVTAIDTTVGLQAGYFRVGTYTSEATALNPTVMTIMVTW